ncbi:MAG: hypothetical protein ACRC76_13295 [Proteocatella sp.]
MGFEICKLYTLDEKFTEGVKLNLGKGALSGAKLFLKNEYKSIKLTCLQRSGIAVTRDSKRALTVVAQYFADKFGTGSNMQENQKRLLANGFFFDADIVRATKSGEVTWWYKNGDKGNEYFSLVYEDDFGKEKMFYPDYLVGIGSDTWIIETKGGFSQIGESQDIDILFSKEIYCFEEIFGEISYERWLCTTR